MKLRRYENKQTVYILQDGLHLPIKEYNMNSRISAMFDSTINYYTKYLKTK